MQGVHIKEIFNIRRQHFELFWPTVHHLLFFFVVLLLPYHTPLPSSHPHVF